MCWLWRCVTHFLHADAMSVQTISGLPILGVPKALGTLYMHFILLKLDAYC